MEWMIDCIDGMMETSLDTGTWRKAKAKERERGKDRESRHECKCKTLCIKGENGTESMGQMTSTLNEAVYMMRLYRSQFGKPNLELKSTTAGASIPVQRWSR